MGDRGAQGRIGCLSKDDLKLQKQNEKQICEYCCKFDGLNKCIKLNNNVLKNDNCNYWESIYGEVLI